MFSTRLNEDRYTVPCIVVSDTPAKNMFVVDTGARFTCCSIFNIDPGLEEDAFAKAEAKNIGGLVYGSCIKYYKHHVKQFTIGNVDLKEQDVWVTFDERATDDVLGMDLMKKVYFTNDPENATLSFFEDKAEFLQNGALHVC